MIQLEPFSPADFDRFIEWIDSKELLVTIAGTVFTYRLTTDQLQSYLRDPKSHSFNIVDKTPNEIIGHAEIIETDAEMCKLDKIIIGSLSNRGKGIGQQLIYELLNYSFVDLGAKIVELNVYDWNIAGIKCYEKAGFTVNPGKRQFTQLDGINWVALNMTIGKDKWAKLGKRT